jgi:hypothetical protein
MFFLPFVLYVKLQRWQQQCQPYLTALCICSKPLLVTILVCVEHRLLFLFLLGIQFFDIHQSVRDVSTLTEISCKDIVLKMSEHNDGEIDYVTNLQRLARTFLADLWTQSPLNFWLIQNLQRVQRAQRAPRQNQPECRS